MSGRLRTLLTAAAVAAIVGNAAAPAQVAPV